MFNKLVLYLKEVRLELAKVNWPTREQTIRYTAVVIAVSLAVAVFLGGLDFAFSWLVNRFVL
ncbi:MAG: preprotein translocase subunit SecE [Parcubacteria group bacterium]|nr:preprotein translocase subunit SecE [Parcubacteria group bacterium]